MIELVPAQCRTEAELIAICRDGCVVARRIS